MLGAPGRRTLSHRRTVNDVLRRIAFAGHHVGSFGGAMMGFATFFIMRATSDRLTS
jgi:hypothetical protein